jgi:hypothetical protein
MVKITAREFKAVKPLFLKHKQVVFNKTLAGGAAPSRDILRATGYHDWVEKWVLRGWWEGTSLGGTFTAKGVREISEIIDHYK